MRSGRAVTLRIWTRRGETEKWRWLPPKHVFGDGQPRAATFISAAMDRACRVRGGSIDIRTWSSRLDGSGDVVRVSVDVWSWLSLVRDGRRRLCSTDDI